MSWPALDDLMLDDDVTRTAVRLYRWLWQKHPEIMHKPVVVKTEAAGRAIRRWRGRIGPALQLLLDRGYLLDYGRLHPNQPRTSPRVVMMPMIRQACSTNATSRDAA